MKWVTLFGLSALLLLAGTAGAANLMDGGDVRDGSLTGKDVRNRSLTKFDFRGSVRGPRGFEGAEGPQGPPGPVLIGQITVVESPRVFYGPSDAVMSAIAFCPAGQRAISGGGVNVADEQLAATLATGGRTGWGVIGVDLVDNGGEYVQAQALCAPGNQAVAANRGAARAEVARMVRQIKQVVAAKR